MPRPLRDLNPEYYHLVTCRTVEARLWMIPSTKLNRVIGGILARYQELCQITIYAYCILGNHLHLVLKDELGNLSEFMESVLREIARRVNKSLQRRGPFWSRRYDDQIIQSTNDLLEAYLYVITNPVKHGLVSRASNWPGLSCYNQVVTESAEEYQFVFYSKLTEEGNFLISNHKLVLTPLPQHAKLTQEERVHLLHGLIADREQELRQVREQEGRGYLGIERIKSQRPGRIPVTVSYAPRPICYTKDSALRKSYRAERRLFRRQYILCSTRFRSGELTVEFPLWCFKPPPDRAPKAQSSLLRWQPGRAAA